MAKNFWENDSIVQPVKTEPLPWEADSIVKSAKAINLEAETKKYEEEVPFLQRITDPFRAGVARLPGILPGIEVSSIQKQINAIREGKGGPRDPVTGESLPFQPEEAEAAIKQLEERKAEALGKIQETRKEAGKFRVRPAVAALSDAKTASETWDLFQVDPLGVMSSVSLESLPLIGPALVLGAVTKNPTVGALAMGSSSFAGELSSGVMENLQDKGVNVNDPLEVNKALNDPKLFAEAYNHALTRASIIGPLDAAAAGLASKMLVPKNVIKSQLAKEAVNIGVAQPTAQIISGAGGEAVAQLATEGEITKPGQVLMEAAGEGPSSVLETAAFGGRQAIDRLRGAQPPAVTPPAVPPVTPVTPGPSPAVIQEGEFEAAEAPEVKPPEAPEVTPTAAAAPAEAPAKKRLLPEKKPNDPAIEAEGFALADQLKNMGDDASANGLRSNLERFGGYTEPKQLQYYKDKLLEAQQKAGKAPEMPKETFNTRNFILNYKADKDRFEKFLPKAPQQVQDTIAKSDQYIQALADKINAAGYKVTDVNPTSPQELINLRRMISGIGGTSFRYLLDAQHVARNNRYANPEKVAQAEKQLAKDFAKADQLLGAVPTPVEEVAPTPEEMAPKATEVVTEPIAEAPKFAEDETGQKLRYPMFVDLADKGYQLYSFENPRTYETKGGTKYRTLEKDGVRIALEPQQLLFTDPKYPNRQPQLGMGTEKDVAFHFIGVDPELRKQGKAKQALQDLIEVADKNDFTLYGEPAQLEKEGMTVEQLTSLYGRYGFKPTDDTGRVIVREPGAKAVEISVEKEVETGVKPRAYPKGEIDFKAKGKLRISSPTEEELAKKLSDYLGGTKISIVGEQVYNPKQMLPYYKVRKEGGRYKLYELPEKAPAKPVEKTQAEINRERQAAKKAVAEAKKAKPAEKIVGKELIESESKPISPSEMAKVGPKISDIRYAQDDKIAFTFNGQDFLIKEPRDVILVGVDKDIARKWIAKRYGYLLEPFAGEKKPEVKEEPVTTKEIEKAVAKAGEKVDYAKMKKAAENQVDQAIKRAKYKTQEEYKKAKIPDAERFVTIKLEGDGSFKVMNNVERLEEFKKKLANAIKPKAAVVRRDWESAAVAFKSESAFKNFLNEQEPDLAMSIANLTGLKIKDVKLNPTQAKILKDYLDAKKEADGNEPVMETIKSKPGANVARVAKMLGPQLYGSPKDITSVSVKEMMQNSFDAIKTMLENGQMKSGDIDIRMNKTTRTIEIKDNGSGMTPETLSNVFLTIAGTKKETEFGSGGFGIAKMLFLFGNKDIEVTTMRDGKISHMEATGKQLMAALEDPDQAPDIEIFTPEQYGKELENDFPDGHGTIVTVTVPESYEDQSTGKTEEIEFDDSRYAQEVLNLSPLFANINVKFNGDNIYIGSKFDADEYTTFVNADFKWGTARIYVSKGERDRYGKNMHVLSNGLWQFSENMKKNPMEMYSDNIPFRFYIDIVSKVKPDEAGYPFNLNRKGFSEEAGKDLNLIKNYLFMHYMKKDFDNTKTSFGNVRYVYKRNDKVTVTDNKNLNPEVEVKEIKDKIDEGSKVEVIDGRLIVNGKEIPVLTPDDLKNAKIDVDELKIPQDTISANQVMIHDNLEVKLTEENYVPISEAARAEFGDRFDSFMFDIGDAFMKLRNRVVSLNRSGELPDYRSYSGDKSYDGLKDEAIGISFDKEYRGVSIKMPFSGMFINPAFPEFIDTPEKAAYGLFGTMIHELAHYQVRSHNADFPAEMQRLTLHLEADAGSILGEVKKQLIDSVRKNKDILDYLNREGKKDDSRSIGQRFKDGSFQGGIGRSAEDVAKSRGEEQRGRGVPGDLRPSYQAIRKEPEPEPVPSKSEAVKKLLEKHKRPKPPTKPSHTVKDAFMGGFNKSKNLVQEIQQEPLMSASNMIGKADRAITQQRNKNIFYGTGLELADRARYGGQVRTAHKHAIASVALTNAIHSGHIATQVMTQGKLIFNPNTQMFQADKDKYSIANVVRAKSKLIKRLGNEEDANGLIQGYFEAKRSRSIINEYLDRTAAYENAKETGIVGEELAEFKKELKNIEIAMQKIQMTDEAIDDFINQDDNHPELKEMMENWTAVNKNMIDMMEFSSLISKKRAETLRNIKDYVPWYRVMDDMEDVHSAPGGTRGMTNVSREKRFKAGEVDRDIDDIVDNMIHNVLTLTRNSMRNYAANRIAIEYGTRNEKGKLQVFPTEGVDKDGVRLNIVAAGKRIVVQIKDPLVAEAVIGMENIDIPMINALAYLANGLRRSITTFPAFQVAQLFMDAPTAALVTGLKNPAAVWSGVFTSFLKNLRKDDPIVATLRSYGIGGYQSSARVPEKEIQLEIGLIQGSWFSKAMKGLDRFGDASDYAQRRSIYMQTLKETKSKEFPDGDELLAIFQANNVIDFQKRGSGAAAQAVTKTVAFMNAYAQSMDVLAKGIVGGGLKGLSRKQAIARMAATGMLLASATIVYCMIVGDDDEYNKLDDQTKMRNIYIPGLDMRLPMHTGASFFFKAVPELIYNKIMKEGTKDEYDKKRLTRALGKAALDSLLGPNITPSGVKPVVEIVLNKNFFTGGQVTPKGMEDLAAFRQYNQNTSELGKIISSLTGTEKTRLLNPMEADHLMRGLLGTAGAAVMWGSNLVIGNRPEPQAKDNPFYGQFIMPEVARGREDLYYDLKSKTDEAYKTHQDLLKKGRKEEAAEWFKENKDLIRVYGYTSSIETNLKELNGEIRRIGDLPESKMNSKQKRERINELQEIKMRVLRDVISMRKRAGLSESYF